MRDAPEAEWHVDVQLAARLVAGGHPEFAGPLRLVANGWDNVVFRLGERHAVRMPRRAVAVALLEHEQRWLPRLAPLLPLPIPAPVAVGAHAPGYPFPWSIVPWIEGVPVWELPPPARRPLARPLAAFLAALHVPAPADAPFNPVRAVPLRDRDAVVRPRFDGRVAGAEPLVALWDDGLDAPVWAGPPVWVHGDVHSGNLVATDAPGGARLAAVIDWGDLSAGDPATDLAAAWTVFAAEGRAEFRAELDRLGGADAAMWRRGRAWAAAIAGSLLETTSGDGPVARMGAHTLAQLLPETGAAPPQ